VLDADSTSLAAMLSCPATDCRDGLLTCDRDWRLTLVRSCVWFSVGAEASLVDSAPLAAMFWIWPIADSETWEALDISLAVKLSTVDALDSEGCVSSLLELTDVLASE